MPSKAAAEQKGVGSIIGGGAGALQLQHYRRGGPVHFSFNIQDLEAHGSRQHVGRRAGSIIIFSGASRWAAKLKLCRSLNVKYGVLILAMAL